MSRAFVPPRRLFESSHAWIGNTYSGVVLPGLGHVPFEEDPEAFTQVMQEWLAALK